MGVCVCVLRRGDNMKTNTTTHFNLSIYHKRATQASQKSELFPTKRSLKTRNKVMTRRRPSVLPRSPLLTSRRDSNLQSSQPRRPSLTHTHNHPFSSHERSILGTTNAAVEVPRNQNLAPNSTYLAHGSRSLEQQVTAPSRR